MSNLSGLGFAQTLPDWRYLPVQERPTGVSTGPERHINNALGKCYREGSAQTFQRFKGQTCSEIGDNSQINTHQKVTPSVWCFDCKSHRSSFVWVFVSLSLMWKTRANWKGLLACPLGERLARTVSSSLRVRFCVKWCNGLFCMDCTVHKSKY